MNAATSVKMSILLQPRPCGPLGRATGAWLHLFASRFYGGNLSEIGRQLVRSECFHVHLNQANERTTEIWFCLSAAIDNYSDGNNNPATVAHDVDRFLDAAAACHDIFHDQEFFPIIDLESAAQNELAIFFFDKDVTFA